MLPHLIGCLVLLAQTAPEPDAADLVGRLGAPRFADRQAADSALRGLGAGALAAVRQARGSDDPEVAARASALVEAIETSVMLEPTRVRLDFRDRTLSEVLAELSRRSGVPIALDPRSALHLRAKWVTLEAPEPLTLWQALDRLGREARLGSSLSAPEPFGDEAQAAGDGIVVFERLGGRPAPSFESGPFRLKVLGSNFQRSRAFEIGPVNAGEVQDFEAASLQVEIAAEPRLLIAARGPIRLTEALDDLGQSLLPSGPTPPPELLELDDDFGFSQGSTILQTLELRLPERAGRTIRRLRGQVVLSVASRRPEPMVVPLADADGRTFVGEEAEVTVHALATDRESEELTLDLSLRTPARGGSAGREPRPGLGEIDFAREFLEQQLEILDAQGRPFVLFPLSIEPEAGGVRLRLLLAPTEGAASPATLRYFGLIRADRELGFEFTGIDMP